ncbi:hypothetical protein Tco_0028047, partial [Tanacetum coccineum]
EDIPLFPAMIVQGPVIQGEGSTHPVESPTQTPIPDETIHEERGDSVERDITSATSLDAEQGSGNIN